MNLKNKLYVYIGGFFLLTLLGLMLYFLNIVKKETARLYEESVNEYIVYLEDFIELERTAKKLNIEIASNYASDYFKKLGSIEETDELVSVGDYKVQKWTLNGEEIQLNYGIVDFLKTKGVPTSTIFQKVGDAYVRISTNILNEAGERAIGTVLNSESPVVKSIENGQKFFGSATILNSLYLTSYEPIYINGEIKGILYVGVPEVDFEALSELFKRKQYFGSGYPYLVNSNGVLIAHPISPGGDISDAEFFKDMKEMKNGYLNYTFMDIDKSQYFKYIESIDSFIAVNWNRADYEIIFAKIRNNVIILSLIGLIIILTVLYLITKNILKQLGADPAEVQLIANKVASGDLEHNFEIKKNDNSSLLYSMQAMVTNIKSITSETEVITNKITNGVLDYRSNESKYEGDYKKLIAGINSSLDAVISPLNVTAEYVDRISKGDIPPKISEEYKGDFNEIKNNINALIDNLNSFIIDMNEMSNQHDLGDIDVIIDTNKYSGAYKQMAVGVNNMVDGHIMVNKKAMAIVNEYGDGNFEATLERLPGKKAFINDTLDAIKSNLVKFNKEILDIIEAANEGNLNYRGNPALYRGDWSKLVQGVNQILDEIVLPIKESVRVLEKVSGGDLRERVELNLKGDHKVLVDAVNRLQFGLNQIIIFIEKLANGDMTADIAAQSSQDQVQPPLIRLRENVKLLIADTNEMIKSAETGDLSKRANISNHKGDYQNIIGGFNKTLDLIITPLNEAINVMQSIADGDLTTKVNGNYKGDLNKLKMAINESVDSMHEILSQVKQTVEEVTRGSMQVADSSTALSQGATEQAASLEEITSSMSEFGSQTKINAENASQASVLTHEAKKSAESGNSEMNELNKAMKEIANASKDISNIIKVIDEIAFQTNLLALNAAVEAARAGHHGKGFAVVAEEVRNLAARSAVAAKDTSKMIESSLKKIEVGSSMSIKTAEVLNEIRIGAIKSADIVAEIATSSNEQAMAISQINEGLQQIDKVTQTNTASAEESASASEELSGQARNLQQMILRFRLKDGDGFDYAGSYKSLTFGNSSKQSKTLASSNKENQNTDYDNPSDIIKLDEDDYGKY